MKKNLIEKIENAKTVLGVSKNEIMNEMINLFRESKLDEMKRLFEAYKNWELRNISTSQKTEDELEELAKDNFDCVANVADEYLRSQDIENSIIAIGLETNKIGPVTRFYRTAISYFPKDPEMN